MVYIGKNGRRYQAAARINNHWVYGPVVTVRPGRNGLAAQSSALNGLAKTIQKIGGVMPEKVVVVKATISHPPTVVGASEPAKPAQKVEKSSRPKWNEDWTDGAPEQRKSAWAYGNKIEAQAKAAGVTDRKVLFQYRKFGFCTAVRIMGLTPHVRYEAELVTGGFAYSPAEYAAAANRAA